MHKPYGTPSRRALRTLQDCRDAIHGVRRSGNAPPLVILSEAKNLKTYGDAQKILRFAQNDKESIRIPPPPAGGPPPFNKGGKRFAAIH